MAVVGALKTFKGGHYFGRFEGTPVTPFEDAPLPERVTVPLRQGFRDEAASQVGEGDAVRTGQIIGRSDELICSPVHAPVSGTVVSVDEGPHPVDGATTTLVAIESDGLDEWQLLELPEGNHEKWGEELGRVLYESGVTALGQAGFPTEFQSALVAPDAIDTIVINAVETEPYLESANALLYEEFDKFVNGLRILRNAIGNVEVHIGLGHDRGRLFEELVHRLDDYDWIYLHPLLPKYPQGHDDVLVKTILDREVPAGDLATSIGVLVSDAHQAVAAYDAVLEGKPYVERALTIGGSAFGRPANARVRVGTPVSELLGPYEHAPPARLILGGPMRGRSVSEADAPVTRDAGALVGLQEPKRRLFGGLRPLSRADSYTNVAAPLLDGAKRATAGLNGQPRPCVSCGDCVDVCPQNLFPIRLAQAAERGELMTARDLGLDACIECGLCSYVCPSKIPLLEQIRLGRQMAREEELAT